MSTKGCADDLHSGGIFPVVHTGDCPITWSTSIYSIGLGFKVYDSYLEEFPESHGDTIDDEHCFPSPNRQLIGKDHPDFRGHGTGMRP